MKKKNLKICAMSAAAALMATALTACGGGGNPFLGCWNDDANEQSFIFNEDGTGEQSSYYGSIEFTYTQNGDTVTITNEDLGVSAEGWLENGTLYIGSSNCVKADEAEYVPENGGASDSANDDYEQEGGEGGDELAEMSFWLGEYSGDGATLTIDQSSGMIYYALGAATDDGFSTASGTLTQGDDPYVLEESELIFTYNEADRTIEVSLQEGVTDRDHYVGSYSYIGPVGGSSDSDTPDVQAPDSIEAWYGEYEGSAGTLSITSSLEDMVDYTAEASDGSYMSGTWTASDAGLGVMEDRELYAIYNVEDGSVEITGKTDSDSENNASFVGVYYPTE